MIVFRTNAGQSVGVGHLARCYRLASELNKRGHLCIFIVDCKDSLILNYLSPFHCLGIYTTEEHFSDQQSDAKLFLGLLKFNVSAIVVDDYRLSETWETAVSSIGSPVVVLDDRGDTLHKCALLIDGKWEGELTKSRYEESGGEECVRLLGPRYWPLDPLFKYSPPRLRNPKANEVNILLSLGGGGNLTLLAKLIRGIRDNVEHFHNYSISVVIGPYSINRDSIYSLSLEDSRIRPIVGAKSLYKQIGSADLYVGAAGGTLYEALSFRVPSLTFSLEQNQNNDLNNLEDLGHYFHVGYFDVELMKKLPLLIRLIIENDSRIKCLYQRSRKIEIDALGISRVTSAIEALISGRKINYELMEPSQISESVYEESDVGYIFESIDDRHINKYLDARNLAVNLKNMTEIERINRIDHYIWWLQSKRMNYVLSKNNESLIYIWHEVKNIGGMQALIGGWFICSENANSVDAMYALNKQLEVTDLELPKIPWIAVIKKTNKYVQILNKRMGFSELVPNNPLYEVVQKCFPLANESDFFYYFRIKV